MIKLGIFIRPDGRKGGVNLSCLVIIHMGGEEAKNLEKMPQAPEQDKSSECNIAHRARELQEQDPDIKKE